MSRTERWHCCYFALLWYAIGQNDTFFSVNVLHCVLHFQRFNSFNFSSIAWFYRAGYRVHTHILQHTSPCNFSLYFKIKKKTKSLTMRVRLNRPHFEPLCSITGIRSPLVLLYVIPYAPRSGHLKPGWSWHFVYWACVSSPDSRTEGQAGSWDCCLLQRT